MRPGRTPFMLQGARIKWVGESFSAIAPTGH